MGALIDGVAKRYKPGVSHNSSAYFDEAMTQAVAETFAQDFNKQPTRRKITFLSSHVLKLVDRSPPAFAFFELMLEGDYAKHNNNYGHIITDDEVPGCVQSFHLCEFERNYAGL